MVARLDPDQPVSDIQTMERIVQDFMSGERIMSQLLGVFSALALVLAAVGVYGVMAYSVGQRTHEIGIRSALGAEARDIRRMVLRQGLVLGGIGIGIGLLAAAAATRFLGYFLLGVNPLDPWAFGGVSAVLLVTILIAAGLGGAGDEGRPDGGAQVRVKGRLNEPSPGGSARSGGSAA